VSALRAPEGPVAVTVVDRRAVFKVAYPPAETGFFHLRFTSFLSF
jgi:hypothetical protein